MLAKLEDWDYLSKMLIERREKKLWKFCLQQSYSTIVFQSVIANCIHFNEPESASVLIKVLIELNQAKDLVVFTGALLEENPKFKTSRSLQTIHLIHLIPQGDSASILKAINELENYSPEEVVRTSVTANRPDLILRILERFKFWSLAFKTAFYVLEDVDKALQIAEKWNNSDAYAVIFQYYLFKEDTLTALKYYSKLPRLDFKAVELVQLLKQKKLYQELYDYLGQLRSKGLLIGDLEREMFECLVTLDRMPELEEFISSASPASATDLGFALAQGKKFALAGEAFIRAGDYDRAVNCLLHTNNTNRVFESALKSKSLK